MTASTWSVIVPVKSAANAKTRLGPAYGRWRPLLARAFALDTVRAVRDAVRTARVVVVTDDEELEGVLTGTPDVRVVGEQGHGDLNASIRAGLANVSADEPVAVVTSDLPALTPADLDDVLALADAQSVGVVADQERVGTTVLTAKSPNLLRPRFGAGSFRLHVADGAAALAAAAGVRRDVDLPEHLLAAAGLGVGPATADVLERIRNGTGPIADPVP